MTLRNKTLSRKISHTFFVFNWENYTNKVLLLLMSIKEAYCKTSWNIVELKCLKFHSTSLHNETVFVSVFGGPPHRGHITRYIPSICPSVCPVPTVNSKTANHTTSSKLDHVRSNCHSISDRHGPHFLARYAKAALKKHTNIKHWK